MRNLWARHGSRLWMKVSREGAADEERWEVPTKAREPSSDPCYARAAFSHKREKGAPLLYLLLNFLAFWLCVSPALAQSAPLPVVASFSILGDFVREVGGSGVDVSTIVGPNGDAHVYEPTPADGRKLARARLVFVNGLGFEGWIDRLIAASKTKAKIVTVSAGVAPRRGEEGLDPHAWQDVANARRYVENIRDALIAADSGARRAVSDQRGRLSRKARRARPRDRGGAGDHPARASKNCFDPRRLRLF